jgi:hypothetical protein
MLAASQTFAARLTFQQCNDYPFVRLHKEVTHAQLMNELAELESAGYDPTWDDDDYPDDLQAAEHKLHAKYEADCTTTSAQALQKSQPDYWPE